MLYLLDILKGILIGICFPIPGVSGSTMAVILGVYPQVIEFMTLAKKKIQEHWKLVVPLIIGALIGIFGFSSLLTKVLFDYPIPLRFAYMGLIVGGLPFIYQQTGVRKPKVSGILWFLLGVAVIVALYFVKTGENVVYTELTLGRFFSLLGSSIVAAIAMITPGISGSFTMLVMGQYQTVITAVSDLNIVLLIPVAIGAIIGILIGANLIKYLLKRWRTQTYFTVLGLALASLLVVYPGFTMDWQGLLAIILGLACAAFSYFFSHLKVGTKKD